MEIAIFITVLYCILLAIMYVVLSKEIMSLRDDLHIMRLTINGVYEHSNLVNGELSPELAELRDGLSKVTQKIKNIENRIHRL